MTEENENRREAFRLTDEILLKIEKLKPLDAELMEIEFEKRRAEFGVLTHLRYGSEKNLPTMRTIERKYPEIAHYLKFLERQIEYISIRNGECDSTGPELTDKQWVNISANGMRFCVPATFAQGEHIQAMMVLSPDELRIVVLATVNRVETSRDGYQQVSVRFTHLHLEDKEALIKHLHKRQIEDLRRQQDD